jgi:hypothetical protein
MSFAARRNPILFIYGANDRAWREFQDEFQTRYLLQNSHYQDIYDIYTIEHANHLMTQRKWQNIALHKIIDWLKRNDYQVEDAMSYARTQ